MWNLRFKEHQWVRFSPNILLPQPLLIPPIARMNLSSRDGTEDPEVASVPNKKGI
jgi:hypothetical protein